MSDQIETISDEDIHAWFNAELEKSHLTYDEWLALGRDCSRQCGCGLSDYPALEWAYKAFRPWLVPS